MTQIPNLSGNKDYREWVAALKSSFAATQQRAARSVNTALLEFYWQLGQEVLDKQTRSQWGDRLLKQLSQDLMAEFPDVKGFSLRNINYIRQWVHFWQQASNDHQEFVQQLVAQLASIPWGHNILIVSKSKTQEEAKFYLAKTLEHGWSRAVLTHQIESGIWEREGKAITNFQATLPPRQSVLAQQTLKDPYLFDFLELTKSLPTELQSKLPTIEQIESELESDFCEPNSKG